eukprot:9495403-Pyramimonas_sp.AAC.2
MRPRTRPPRAPCYARDLALHRRPTARPLQWPRSASYASPPAHAAPQAACFARSPQSEEPPPARGPARRSPAHTPRTTEYVTQNINISS